MRHAVRSLPLLSPWHTASRCAVATNGTRAMSGRLTCVCPASAVRAHDASALVCSVRHVSQLSDEVACETSLSSAGADDARSARQRLLAHTLGYDPAKVNTLLQRIHGSVRDEQDTRPVCARGGVERGLHCRRRDMGREGWRAERRACKQRHASRGDDGAAPDVERLVKYMCEQCTTATSTAAEMCWSKPLLLVYTAHTEATTLDAHADTQPASVPPTAPFASFLRRHIYQLRAQSVRQTCETVTGLPQAYEPLHIIAILSRCMEDIVHTTSSPPRADRARASPRQEHGLPAQCHALDELASLLARLETRHTAHDETDAEAHTRLLWQLHCQGAAATSLLACATMLGRMRAGRSDTAAGLPPLSAPTSERVQSTCMLLCSTLCTVCAVPVPAASLLPMTHRVDGVCTALRCTERLLRVMHYRQRIGADDKAATVERRAAVSVCMMHMVWLTQAVSHSLAREQAAEGSEDGALSTSVLPMAWSSFQRAVRVMEELWQAIVVFTAARTLVNTPALHHRSTHSALNFRLAELWRGCRRDRNARHRHVSCVASAATRQQWRRQTHDGSAMGEEQEDDMAYAYYAAAPEQTMALAQAWRALIGAMLEVARGRSSRQPLLLRWAAAATHEVAVTCALLCRTGLDLELGVVCAAARALGAEWSVPVQLAGDDIRGYRLHPGAPPAEPTTSTQANVPGTEDDGGAEGHRDDGDVAVTGDVGAQQARWRRINACCTQLRTSLALLVEECFMMLARVELVSDTAGASSPPPSPPPLSSAPSTMLIQMMKSSYYPLMRRHWYITNGCREGDLGADAAGRDDAMVCDGSSLMASCLRVFVLVKELATAAVAKDAVDVSSSPSAPQLSAADDRKALCCGTTLLQAMEVAFFLSYFVARWGGQGGSAEATLHDRLGIATHDVEAYVKEMLSALDHKTAKQLWHLHNSDRLFYFSGLKRDKTPLQDEHLRLRYARSTLEVVLAHVLHPSLLWMPLWQLQEMVFIVTHNMHLFYQPASPMLDGDDARRVAHHSVASVDTAPGVAADTQTGTAAAAWSRQVVRVHGQATDFGRLQHYLVLRLYVVANTLRALRNLLQRRAEAQIAALERRHDAVHETSPSSTEHEARLRRARGHARLLAGLARHERGDEATRRTERRSWAHAMATLMLTQYSTLPAMMEGVYGDRRGTHRALRRMEATLQAALRHNVLLEKDATGAARQRAQWLRVSVGNGAAEDDVGTVTGVEAHHSEPTAALPTCAQTVCRLTLRREHATASLGFVLDGATATVRRVCATDAAEEAASPFVQAASAAGFANASSLIGWRVAAVDAREVKDGRAAIDLVRGKLCVELTLRRKAAAARSSAASSTQ